MNKLEEIKHRKGKIISEQTKKYIQKLVVLSLPNKESNELQEKMQILLEPTQSEDPEMVDSVL
jgi:hypothetical protein